MTPEQFCYWLQGFAEIHQDQPNGQEWIIIMDHLAQVFRKETPERKKTIEDFHRQWKEQTPTVTPDFGKWPIDIKPGDIIC
jgi:hypothetical protein